MAGKKKMPSLENALEAGFSELNAGEENIVIEEKATQKVDSEQHVPEYGLKINVEENREVFFAKPIRATMKTVEESIDTTPEIVEEVEVVVKQEVLDSPSSKMGDDFAVDW